MSSYNSDSIPSFLNKLFHSTNDPCVGERFVIPATLWCEFVNASVNAVLYFSFAVKQSKAKTQKRTEER